MKIVSSYFIIIKIEGGGVQKQKQNNNVDFPLDPFKMPFLC